MYRVENSSAHETHGGEGHEGFKPGEEESATKSRPSSAQQLHDDQHGHHCKILQQKNAKRSLAMPKKKKEVYSVVIIRSVNEAKWFYLVPMAPLSFKSCSTKAEEESERLLPMVMAAAVDSPLQ